MRHLKGLGLAPECICSCSIASFVVKWWENEEATVPVCYICAYERKLAFRSVFGLWSLQMKLYKLPEYIRAIRARIRAQRARQRARVKFAVSHGESSVEKTSRVRNEERDRRAAIISDICTKCI